MKTISVTIPTYEMKGLGHIFLKKSLDILCNQTFKDFDVVISDNATTDIIKNVCIEYKEKLVINYFKNDDPLHGMSSNINNALKNATGDIVKILFLDDFLSSEKSLEIIANNFDLKEDSWLATGCIHTKDGISFYYPHYPSYNKKVYLGKNTIGSPSVIAIKNQRKLFFDENIHWLMDCDFYKRYYDHFGAPKLIDDITVAIRTGKHQVTDSVTNALIEKERLYVENKNKITPLHLKNVTLVAVSGIDPDGAINALEISMKEIDYYEVVLISHKKPDNLNPKIKFKQCRPTELASKDPKNKDDYSNFMAYNLCNYIESDFCLIVHNDAYVIRPNQWTPEFLEYDYIGAPWPPNTHFTKEGVNIRIGNGGFSLRSKRLLNILNELNLPFTHDGTGFYNEDGIICVYYHKQLKEAGILFPPIKLAARFSHELDVPESDPYPFGFHNHKITSKFKNFKIIWKYIKKII